MRWRDYTGREQLTDFLLFLLQTDVLALFAKCGPLDVIGCSYNLFYIDYIFTAELIAIGHEEESLEAFSSLAETSEFSITPLWPIS